MKRYTNKKAGRYFNRLLDDNFDTATEILNAWSDDKGRWYACNGYVAYRVEAEPDGLREVLGLKVNPGKFEQVHKAIEAMFATPGSEDVSEIPVDLEEIVEASRHEETRAYDLGDEFPVVNARYLRDALEMLPDGKVYCENNSQRMIRPVYVKSGDGMAVILPIRRDRKIGWMYRG